MYESDITRFLRELKAGKPQLAQQQREGRALWWDHPQNPDTQEKHDESRVRQSAYVYQSGH